MNSVNTITETYDPTGKVATKEEITSNSEIGRRRGPEDHRGSTKKDETTITEYQVGKTVKQQTVLPGEIKSLSVAAFVDLTADANQPGAGGQPALLMSVAEVEQIIRTALGLKESDSLKVVNARFHRSTESRSRRSTSAWSRYLAMARHLSLGLMAVCAVIVLRIFSRARSKADRGSPGPVAAGRRRRGPAAGGRADRRAAVRPPADRRRPEAEPRPSQADVPQLDPREGVETPCL